MGEILRKKTQTFTQHFGLCSSVLCQTWKRKDVAKILECGRRGYYKFGFNQGEELWKAERKQQFGSNSAPSGKIPPLTLCMRSLVWLFSKLIAEVPGSYALLTCSDKPPASFGAKKDFSPRSAAVTKFPLPLQTEAQFAPPDHLG